MVDGNTEVLDEKKNESEFVTGVNLVKAKDIKKRRLSWKEHRFFVIAFSVLGTLVVGLAVAIVVVSIVKNNVAQEIVAEEQQESGSGECSGSGDGESSEAEDTKAKNEAIIADMAVKADDMTISNAVSYLEDKLEEYKGTELEFGAKMVLIYRLLNNGDANEALEIAKGIDPTGMFAEDQMNYHNAMYKIYVALGDNTTARTYQAQYTMLYNYLYEEEFGDAGDVEDEE